MYPFLSMFSNILHTNNYYKLPTNVLVKLRDLTTNKTHSVNYGSHVVYGVGRQPLDCWDHRFKSHCEHGFSSLVFVVCCLGYGEHITHSEESYQVCVCVCVCERERESSAVGSRILKRGRLGPIWAVAPNRKGCRTVQEIGKIYTY